MTSADLKLSVLDRSLIRRGQDPADALRGTVRFARELERLGYERIWVSEHHSVPGVAGSAPTVLAAAVASATSRIRVGTGGVMLPNHRPLVVAEQFGVLESLFPGRIDMGLGRSVGFTDGVRKALGVGKDEADDFSERLGELLGWVDGCQSAFPGVHAIPAEGLRIPAYVLAISGGADIAAEHGLPLVIGAGRDISRTQAAIERYRAAFRPSARAAEPYVTIAASVAVAATADEAALLQIPEAWATVWSRTRGVFPELEPPRETLARELTDRERKLFDEARQPQIHGTEAEVRKAVDALVDATGADELLVSLHTYEPEQRLDSYRRLAELVKG
ncbi:LLM class flavin-dependent oxidoreductase [Streptomyces sp. A7024]|uniref:LLM class flavin-dependent oxidoreductase n=1 Tax=Streptomyces coryli TaxID=1128680 RepID=A0A6G4TWY1_9ACTN|nr:LLM class flavin-dependent oxidoreductase [Streptomyces coryli]NGN63511.1 LLM class flavin-dependent oxidoreductase [Streptomyces coryli]